jgi:hypothetical protein
VKRTYRRLSLSLHPDTGGSAEAFIELQEQYDSACSIFQSEGDLEQEIVDMPFTDRIEDLLDWHGVSEATRSGLVRPLGIRLALIAMRFSMSLGTLDDRLQFWVDLTPAEYRSIMARRKDSRLFPELREQYNIRGYTPVIIMPIQEVLSWYKKKNKKQPSYIRSDKELVRKMNELSRRM